jgi:hypothetical protein
VGWCGGGRGGIPWQLAIMAAAEPVHVQAAMCYSRRHGFRVCQPHGHVPHGDLPHRRRRRHLSGNRFDTLMRKYDLAADNVLAAVLVDVDEKFCSFPSQQSSPCSPSAGQESNLRPISSPNGKRLWSVRRTRPWHNRGALAGHDMCSMACDGASMVGARVRKTGGNRSGSTGSWWNLVGPVHEPVRFPPQNRVYKFASTVNRPGFSLHGNRS